MCAPKKFSEVKDQCIQMDLIPIFVQYQANHDAAGGILLCNNLLNKKHLPNCLPKEMVIFLYKRTTWLRNRFAVEVKKQCIAETMVSEVENNLSDVMLKNKKMQQKLLQKESEEVQLEFERLSNEDMKEKKTPLEEESPEAVKKLLKQMKVLFREIIKLLKVPGEFNPELYFLTIGANADNQSWSNFHENYQEHMTELFAKFLASAFPVDAVGPNEMEELNYKGDEENMAHCASSVLSSLAGELKNISAKTGNSQNHNNGEKSSIDIASPASTSPTSPSPDFNMDAPHTEDIDPEVTTSAVSHPYSDDQNQSLNPSLSLLQQNPLLNPSLLQQDSVPACTTPQSSFPQLTLHLLSSPVLINGVVPHPLCVEMGGGELINAGTDEAACNKRATEATGATAHEGERSQGNDKGRGKVSGGDAMDSADVIDDEDSSTTTKENHCPSQGRKPPQSLSMSRWLEEADAVLRSCDLSKEYTQCVDKWYKFELCVSFVEGRFDSLNQPLALSKSLNKKLSAVLPVLSCTDQKALINDTITWWNTLQNKSRQSAVTGELSRADYTGNMLKLKKKGKQAMLEGTSTMEVAGKK
ncbi:uncharacterized protein EV420DRAFT_1486679 [Desarmillaria tabescens]|uniref:Uncharacterized protein n=1 Tax=Armillaria tabescens TaxID=1929756 RepID=A0AA39JBY5_ARMTA|nr:uncharacterized protein EV420DRAFT_1486679 [Desarmillaria tabescens]KAK0438504.1 hypothetical protein EV420DRAFT_1486679 [Desarmillaria tabescens]